MCRFRVLFYQFSTDGLLALCCKAASQTLYWGVLCTILYTKLEICALREQKCSIECSKGAKTYNWVLYGSKNFQLVALREQNFQLVALRELKLSIGCSKGAKTYNGCSKGAKTFNWVL